MNKDMPTDGFEWVEDLTEVPTVGAIDPEAEKDYILEVELDYPQKLHDAHNDYLCTGVLGDWHTPEACAKLQRHGKVRHPLGNSEAIRGAGWPEAEENSPSDQVQSASLAQGVCRQADFLEDGCLNGLHESSSS